MNRRVEMSMAVARFLRRGRIAHTLDITDDAFAQLLRWCLTGSTKEK